MLSYTSWKNWGCYSLLSTLCRGNSSSAKWHYLAEDC